MRIPLLTGLLLFLFVFPRPLPAQKYQLLWEIKAHPAAPPSYLFGTMHVTDANMFQLPDSVPIAIENCEGFATEVAFDEALGQVMEMVLGAEEAAGRSTEDLQERLMEMMGGGGKGAGPDPMKLFENFGAPYEPGESMETFLDAFLYRIARDQGKVVGGLEEIDAQMKRLLSNDDAFASGGGKGGESILKNAYLKGDLDAIQAFLESPAVPEAFRQEVLINRNYSMAEVADSLLQLRSTFLAVGAGHLPGDEGMVELFRKKGYLLRPVQATYTGVIDDFLEQEYAPRWQTYADDRAGIRLDVPVPPFSMELIEGEMDMQMGMDLPGGFFYAFYRMRLPFGADASIRNMVMDEVFAKMEDEAGEMETLEVEGEKFSGREMLGETGGYFFRSRIVFDAESMVFLMVGISEKVARGKAAGHFLESLETYEPKSVFEGEWTKRRYESRGFAVDFPAAPKVEQYTQNSDETRPFEQKRAMSYLLSDDYHGNFMQVLCLDLPPNTVLEDDSLYLSTITSEFQDGEVPPPMQLVTRNGISGWESSFLQEGDSMHFRLAVRGLRTYLLTFSARRKNPLNSRADVFFDSFEFLPLERADLTKSGAPPHLTKRLNAPPALMLQAPLPFSKPGVISATLWMGQDSLSGTGFTLTEYRFSPYFRANSPHELLAEFDPEHANAPMLVNLVPPNARFTYHRLIPPQVANGPNTLRQVTLTGDRVWVAEAKFSNDFDAKAPFLNSYFQDVTPKNPLPHTALQWSKAKPLLSDLRSKDDSIYNSALEGLWAYEPASTDFNLFLEAFRKDTGARVHARINFARILLAFDEPAGREAVAAAYQEPSKDFRLPTLIHFLNSEVPANQSLGISLLEEGFPEVNAYYAVESFFENVPVLSSLLISRPQTRKALLSNPLSFLELAWWLDEQVAEGNWSKAQASVLLDEMVLQADSEMELGAQGKFAGKHAMDLEPVLVLLLGQCKVLGWTNSRRAFAHRIISEGPGRSPSTAALALLEGDQTVSKEELEGLATENAGGYELLEMLIRKEKTKLLPKKLFAHEHLARMALLGYSAENAWSYGKADALSKLEFMEKQEIWWEGKDVDVYVFRCAFPEDKEWRMGIAGPFPQRKGEIPEKIVFRAISESPYFPQQWEELFDELVDKSKRNLYEGGAVLGD